ncbi:MAG: septum formation initiator family protein [Candidatus Bipolaricaulota bacterium]|nr:septum formation initiator family protein [Candidatus Bipolaricaulota bacterium]
MRGQFSPSQDRNSPKRGVWRHRITPLLIATLLVLLCGFYLFKGIQIHRLEQELGLLSERKGSAIARQEQLRARLALRDDPNTIENLARAQLGLIRPGEEKVIFIEGE